MRARISSALKSSRVGFLRRLGYIGPKNALVYFFFQRIMRINSHVPWPVHMSSNVTHPGKIKINDWRPYLGYLPGQYIQAMNGIEIGKNLRVGPGVKIISASHDLNDYSLHVKTGPIVIGDNCWLGANSVILPGVRLGDHVVVAAGAVVAKDVPSNSLVGGVPAKIIRELGVYVGASSKW